MPLFVKLALVPVENEGTERRPQGMNAAGKATRPSGQTSQVVAQFGIVRFDREGVGLALRDFVHPPVIPQTIIGIKSIAVVMLGLGGFIHHRLDHFLGSLPDHFETQIAAGETIYDGDDEDLVFFSPMKVNTSSISASLTCSGTGGSGSWAAWAWTHSDTVR